MPRERQSEIQNFNMWGGVSRGSVPLLVENALSLAAKSHPELETWLSDTSCGRGHPGILQWDTCCGQPCHGFSANKLKSQSELR